MSFGRIPILKLRKNLQADIPNMNGGRFLQCFNDLFNKFFWSLGFAFGLKDKKQLGSFGEWSAKKFLLRKDFKVIASNWRSRRDSRNEIDLICMDNGGLVFVEVRTRSSNSFCSGYESINGKKRKSLLRSFKLYLNENSIRLNNYRFDVVEIDICPNKYCILDVHHHENIAIFDQNLH